MDYLLIYLAKCAVSNDKIMYQMQAGT